MISYITSLEGISPSQLEGFFVGWKKPLNVEQHYEILKNSAYFCLAYDTEQKKVIGFVNALSDHVNFAFIPMLEVLPLYKNKGIGSQLMKNILEQLSHITCIDLSCDEELQSFYQEFGMLKSHGMVVRRYLAE